MKNNKITILLGAGFAKYCKGLSTKDINQIFSNYAKWKVDKKSLYDYIEEVLMNDYSDFNFETFLAILENIISYRLSQYRNGQTFTSWKGITPTMFDLKPVFEQCLCLKNQESAYEVYRSYINLINEKVLDYDDCTKCEKEIGLFKKYICYLQGNNNIKIYSTNYDLIVPKALGIEGINLGIRDDLINPEFTYDVDGFRHLPLTYFPLHGCSYIFQKAFGRFYLSNIIQPMPYYGQSNRGGNPNNETLFTPFISGYSKLEHINGRPFNFGLQTFANDCFDSNFIITMGYSYSDTHLNSIIDTFSKCNIESVTLDREPTLPGLLSLRTNTYINGIQDYLNISKTR